jgi:hypothetical protein
VALPDVWRVASAAVGARGVGSEVSGVGRPHRNRCGYGAAAVTLNLFSRA